MAGHEGFKWLTVGGKPRVYLSNRPVIKAGSVPAALPFSFGGRLPGKQVQPA